MNIKITNKEGLTLRTAKKYCEEDIAITLDESFVQPSGTLEITENGTHNVSEYENANVNVPIPDGYIIPEGTLEITENGEQDVTNYASVNVNVASSGSGEDMLQTKVDISQSCAYLFYNYEGDNVDFISDLDTSKVTNMERMFYGCSALTSIPQLDTSNVTNIGYIFYGCYNLTSAPQLDTSKVTNMQYMFHNCSALTSIPQLDTSNVTKMPGIFCKCRALTSVQQLDTSKINNTQSMFEYCSALETIDITYYNISTASYSSKFVYGCTALKSLIIRGFGSDYVAYTSTFQNSGIANKIGYIYVPRAMVDTLKSATNWSIYASQIRALEDYTVDGTTTGALDSTKI